MKPDLKNLNLGSLLEDVLSLASVMRTEGRGRVRGQLEKFLGTMDFVSRKEFEAVRAIAIAARTQAEDVAAHVGMKKKATAKVKKKPAAKKDAKKKK
jgi:BMFP domain-containing protein YqiC